MTPLPGEVLAGRYRLVEQLGSGGMGQVFRAVDEELGRDVAVKVLAPHLLDDPRAKERLRREARSAAALTHPNVVTLYDTTVDDEQQFLVMEFVDGQTLAARLEEGPLPESEAIRVADEVAAALEAAHAQGLVHCDIKPANLLLHPDGRVKVTDFGIARVVDATQTTTGQVYGSVPYIAPERARGELAGPSSDLYALGCILYEMVTGQPPFVGSTPTDTLSQHLHAVPQNPSELRTGVSAGLDAVVVRLLAKEPTDRHEDATSLRRDLARLAAGAPPIDATLPLPAALAPTTRIDSSTDAPATPSAVPAGGRGRRIAWIVAGLVLVAIIGFALANPSADDVAGVTPSDVASPTAAPVATEPGATATTPVSEPAPEPTTPEDAIADLRGLLVQGRDDGLLSDKGVTELDKYLAEALKKLGEGKSGDAAKEVQEFRRKLGDLEKDGDIDSRFVPTLDAEANELTRIVRSA
jgi:serine/threonine-protein kinase